MTDLQTASTNARHSAQTLREAVRPYTPIIVNRLALTYFIPMLAVIAFTTAASLIFGQFLPASTLSLLTLGINIGILVLGFRWAERRLKGTSLFILWTRFSKERRELLALLQRVDDGHEMSTEIIDLKLGMLREAADNLTAAVHDLGVRPQATT